MYGSLKLSLSLSLAVPQTKNVNFDVRGSN